MGGSVTQPSINHTDTGSGFNSQIVVDINLGYGECMDKAHEALSKAAELSWVETSSNMFTPRKSRDAGVQPNKPFEMVNSSLWKAMEDDKMIKSWTKRPFALGKDPGTSYRATIRDFPFLGYSWNAADPIETLQIVFTIRPSQAAIAHMQKRSFGYMVLFRAKKITPATSANVMGANSFVEVEHGGLAFDPDKGVPAASSIQLNNPVRFPSSSLP
jgi:hypothetical protein